MALTGLQIQKLLPQTNCRECGSNTCLAFAMKLAAKKAEISLCPYASDEAKQVLGEANEPPVKSIRFGTDMKLVTGDETVLYRHEKTFVNETIIAVNINDTDSAESQDAGIAAVKDYALERVGQILTIGMAAVTQKSGDKQKFISLVKKVYEVTGKPLILRSGDAAALTEAAVLIKGSNSIICADGAGMAAALAKVCGENGHAMSVSAPDLDSLIEISTAVKESGFANIILNFKTFSLPEQLQTSTIVRRAAIKDSFKPLGYPFLRFIDSGDLMDDTVEAMTEITRYGGICVLPSFNAAQLASLLTLRLNIFTDPQKPIQVEPKIYQVGEPGPDSPVFVTTNFSLTFFIVSGEIENSGTSAWLAVPECEGMSVLTAWAAGKFSAPVIAKFIQESGLENQIKTRELIIPGYVSQLSGAIEEKLPGWKVVVGPQEAGDIESFIKSRAAV